MRTELMAEDIDPQLLDGLIPVDAPAFVGEDGELHLCQTFGWRLLDFDPVKLSEDHFSDDAVKALLEVARDEKHRMKYIYHIWHDEDPILGHLYYVRGA